jgi:outer membrane protein assembly factor BamA
LGVRYPFDKIRSLRINAGVRADKVVIKGISDLPETLEIEDAKQTYGLLRLEYVHDNTVQKTLNILNGLRYKVYVDYNTQLANSNKTIAGRTTFNVGWDARYYYPIFQNFIWAGRAAADFSWGDKKIVYYLGGQDGWLFPKANNEVQPQDPDYAFQALAVNMRGHRQNITNGNNAVVLNSEFRFPVFTTLLKRPINNAFLRNFQLVQFVDLGTAWNGSYNGIQRPSRVYQEGNVLVKIKAGGVGPFVGGYGFGARSTLLGYFLRLDTGWEMNGVFKGKPIWHFAMGIDF